MLLFIGRWCKVCVLWNIAKILQENVTCISGKKFEYLSKNWNYWIREKCILMCLQPIIAHLSWERRLCSWSFILLASAVNRIISQAHMATKHLIDTFLFIYFSIEMIDSLSSKVKVFATMWNCWTITASLNSRTGYHLIMELEKGLQRFSGSWNRF